MRRHPHLFEISAWPWLERLSRAEGRTVTLATVPASQWDAIAAAGFDVVFLMGVWRRSAIGREIARTHAGLRAEYDRALPGWTTDDVVGSPYSIASYEPDERMDGWRGVDTARRELASRGIGLMLDFVPNHTGFEHAWLTTHPERYVLGSEQDYRAAPDDFRVVDTGSGTYYVACGRDPFFPPWTDVAQLNYFNPDTREAMIDVLRGVSAHCDGVRCDMAMLALNDVFERTWNHRLEGWARPADEFWSVATKAVPSLTYLAEVYWDLEATLLAQGFDFAYDKRLLDALHAGDRASRVRSHIGAGSDLDARLARFIENHDESRSASSLEPIIEAAAAVVATLPGMRFFYDGQLHGRRRRVPVQLGRWPDEPIDSVTADMYERLLGFASGRALHDGEWQPLAVTRAGDDSFAALIAHQWRTTEALAVVVINLGDGVSHGMVQLEVTGESESLVFRDEMTGGSYPWRVDDIRNGGLYVRLESGQAHLFSVTPGGTDRHR